MVNTKLLQVTIALTIALMYSCNGDNSKNSKEKFDHPLEKKMKDRFMGYFNIPPNKKEPLVGVWKADQKELIQFVKKKFLKKNKLPEGKTYQDLAEQLNLTNMYLNFTDGGRMGIFFFAYNGMPAVNFGKYKNLKKDKLKRTYSGVLTEKNKKGKPYSLTLKTTKQSTRLIYKEEIGSLTFYRDERPAPLILEEYALRLRRSATDLNSIGQ